MEIWKDIKGYEGYYQVSNLGNVRSVDREIYSDKLSVGTQRKLKGKMIKPYINKRNGYVYVYLAKNNKGVNKRIHRLVAESFIDNINNRSQVNHKDGNKANNSVANLEWCTNQYNVLHAYNSGLLQHYSRGVKQLTKDGKYLKTFQSIKDACNEINGHHSNIIKCIQGNIRTAYGYKWEYES